MRAVSVHRSDSLLDVNASGASRQLAAGARPQRGLRPTPSDRPVACSEARRPGRRRCSSPATRARRDAPGARAPSWLRGRTDTPGQLREAGRSARDHETPRAAVALHRLQHPGCARRTADQVEERVPGVRPIQGAGIPSLSRLRPCLLGGDAPAWHHCGAGVGAAGSRRAARRGPGRRRGRTPRRDKGLSREGAAMKVSIEYCAV